MVRSVGEQASAYGCSSAGDGRGGTCEATRPGGSETVFGGSVPLPGASRDPDTRDLEVRTQVAMTTCQARSSSCQKTSRPSVSKGYSDIAVGVAVTPLDAAGGRCGGTVTRVTRVRVSQDAHHASVLHVLSMGARWPACARVGVDLTVANLTGDPIEVNEGTYVIRRIA